MWQEFQATLLNIVAKANSYMADYALIFLLIGIGVFFSIRTKFVQVRCFGAGFKQLINNFSMKGGKQKSGLSGFQALATAISAQVGTGNIVGACGAILVGGPGAIFWMWVIAFLGMATIYAEAVLAQKTRVVDADGTVHGGPVYYIKQAFKGTFGKILAVFFAVAAVLALGFMGSMVQSNSIAEAVTGAITNVSGFDFSAYQWVIGAVVAALAAAIFLGGINRIASVTEKIVPVMAGLYIVGSLVVIFARIQYIPETFGMIFKYAVTPNALIGGGIGFAIKTAISQGAKRGLFSNEAGMGSTPHAHALANVKDPHDQGIAAMMGVFIDTFIVVSMTGLVVISTLYAGGGTLGKSLVYATEGGLLPAFASQFGKTGLAQMAFGTVFGETFGHIFVSVCLFFFAFSTIVSWNLFGKINAEYLFGKVGTTVYAVLSVGFIFLGSCFKNDLVWELTDFFNYLMVFPNVIAIAVLSGLVAKAAAKKKECCCTAANAEAAAAESAEDHE